jgi:hypothetical protein
MNKDDSCTVAVEVVVWVEFGDGEIKKFEMG